MSHLARSGARNDSRTRGLGRRFVNSLGGSRRAAASTVAGRESARRLGGFLSGVVRDGIVRTLERLDLRSYIGQSVSALLAALARTLAPSGATVDDATAAVAYHETMAELIEKLDLDVDGITAFDRMDEELVRSTMESHVANVVTTRLLHVLSAELEHGAVSPERAVEVEREVRDYVASAVILEFGRQPITDLNWDSPAATRLIERLFQQGYEIFGGRR
jgi:hypothetical protein